MRTPKYDLTTANPGGGVVPAFNPSAALVTAPAAPQAFVHPFQIRRLFGDPVSVIVGTDSLLFNAIGTGGSVDIANLGSDFPAEAGDNIYLHGVISSGTFDSAEIIVTSSIFGDVVFSGGDQTDFYLVIGTADGIPDPQTNITGFKLDDETWVYQRVFTHLRLTNFCVDNEGEQATAIFPIPT